MFTFQSLWSALKVIWLPSGDQSSVLPQLPILSIELVPLLTTVYSPVPSAFTTFMEFPPLKAIFEPSGDHLGTDPATFKVLKTVPVES